MNQIPVSKFKIRLIYSFLPVSVEFSVFSNHIGTQNVSCLGHCGWDICPKTLYLKWAEPSVLGALKELISWRR